MKRVLALLLAVLLPAAAFADPLPLADDLRETVTVLYDEEDPSAGRYEYTYCYPYADPEDPTAYLVNTFFEERVRDTKVYTIPNLAEYYADMRQSVTVALSYEIMYNGDEFFSVRIRRTQEVEDEEPMETWDAYTFSRVNGMPGNTCSLPQVLGTLDTGESDVWMENRRTEELHEVVCDLIWEQVEDNPDGIPYWDDLTEEELAELFDPDLDFWLDENGDPVFFILPGQAADPDAGLLIFPVPMEEICDELVIPLGR